MARRKPSDEEVKLGGHLYLGEGVYVPEAEVVAIISLATLADTDFLANLPGPVERLSAGPRSLIITSSGSYLSPMRPRTLMDQLGRARKTRTRGTGQGQAEPLSP